MSAPRPRPPGPILWRSSLKNTIYDVLKGREGWQETESETEWDFFWADKGWIHNELDKVHLAEWQRVNHFPNHYELTRKDLLLKNLKRAKRQLEREQGRGDEAAGYGFFPQTFVVPAEYRMLAEEFKRGGGGAWIMKPIGRAQGQGIFLFNRLAQARAGALPGAHSALAPISRGSARTRISEWRRDHTWKPDDEEQAETYLAQRYLDTPYLVGGKKFDLRIYALVTSYSPLRIYLYRRARARPLLSRRQAGGGRGAGPGPRRAGALSAGASGFARFTNARFSMRKEDIGNTFVHLTNVAIQKHAPGFDKAKGMKWPIRSLRAYMLSRHGPDATHALFGSIQGLIVRTLLAVQPAMINDRHCFELYGYDILVDAGLKPWLLEVNASPSLSASDRDDWTLKYGMLNDMLDIVDLEGRREPGKVPTKQGGFDLIWDGAAVPGFDRPTSLPTMLGCYNPRDATQLRRPLAVVAAEDAAARGEGGGGGGARERAAAGAARRQLSGSSSGSSSGGGGGTPRVGGGLNIPTAV
ncbi:MAG: tubulin tyrosine ligase-like family, member 9 [Monoraphidium minutum]|nr:MAG: tubulin tyrosine ligase-like family, member 9 [Monoraphidium minutum]